METNAGATANNGDNAGATIGDPLVMDQIQEQPCK